MQADIEHAERATTRRVTRRELVAMLAVCAFVIATVADLDDARTVFVAAKDWVVDTFDWFFAGIATLCLVVVAWIGADPRFNVRLGRDDERPEFTNLAWFAMLFSAGLASGVLYWATAEPISHFQGNPHLALAGQDPLTPEAAQMAVTLTIFHWGLHGWSFYVLTGLSVAYFAFRRGHPLALRSALVPVLGANTHRWPGFLVDFIGVVGTVFGVATSIGLAVGGMNAALGELFGIAISRPNQLLIVALVAGLGILSVVSGVSRGIRRLSELNVYLSAALLVAVLVIGPTRYLLELIVSSLGDYLEHVLPLGVWTARSAAGETWQGDWTMFYWGWWLAWAPFVGLFIARISRGRTVREFVVGVMLVPTLSVTVWMSVFGGTALYSELAGDTSIIDAVNADYAVGTVTTLESLGVLAIPLVCVVAVLLFTWLVTSIDSATLVICMLLKRDQRDVSTLQKTVWGVLLGLITGLLLVAGGVGALQAASIVAGLPVGLVMLGIGYGVLRRIRRPT